MKESAKHIWKAQKELKHHWGARYPWMEKPGKFLVRDYPSSKKNRRVACKGLVKTAKNNSCDEYPFNSTRQGAWYVGRHNVSVEAIPLRDNTTAGSYLSRFYRINRMLDRDRFWVEVLK